MKNNIVQFTRPITLILCQGNTKGWLRSFGIYHDLIVVKSGDKKVVSDIIDKKLARVALPALVELVSKDKPIKQSSELLGFNFPDDP